MSDSIRANRTWEDVVQEIKMEFDADIERKCCIVLVEGKDDCRFINKIFLDNVIAVESSSGKSELEKIVLDEKIKCNRLISIRDRDYMDIANLPEKMFVYDNSCLEVMLFANKNAQKNYYDIHYQGKKGCEDYIENIFRELAPFSVLRKQNEEEGGRIDFKIGIADCFDEEEKVDMCKIFTRVHQSSEKMDACVSRADSMSDEMLWNITNGHDFFRLLATKTEVGGKLMNANGVMDLILAIYRLEDFKTTNLYRDLCTYQLENGAKFVDI